MKSLYNVFLFLVVISFSSCQTRIVDAQKPLQTNTLELYQKYNIQTNDGKTLKVKVLKQDEQSIYAKTGTGEDVVITKNDVRQIKKMDWFSSAAIGVAAIAAVIFVPI